MWPNYPENRTGGNGVQVVETRILPCAHALRKHAYNNTVKNAYFSQKVFVL